MLVQSEKAKDSTHAASSPQPSVNLPSSMIEHLDHPESDRDARCAFENSMVWELVRRFGDHRVIDDRMTRSWVLHVVRRHYWRIWAYLIVSSLLWGASVLAFVSFTIHWLKPELTGVGYLFMMFMSVMTISPIFSIFERRLCGRWVLSDSTRSANINSNSATLSSTSVPPQSNANVRTERQEPPL